MALQSPVDYLRKKEDSILPDDDTTNAEFLDPQDLASEDENSYGSQGGGTGSDSFDDDGMEAGRTVAAKSAFAGPAPRPAAPSSPALDPSAYNAASQKVADIAGQRPGAPKPKWWQRLAAGAVGGLAGFSNAEGKAGPQINPAAAEDALLGGPQSRRQLSDWQRQLDAATAQQATEAGKLSAAEKIQRVNAEAQMRRAQMQAAQARLEREKRLDNAQPGLIHAPNYIYDPVTKRMVWQNTPAQPKSPATYEAYLVAQLSDPDPAKAAAAKAELQAMKEKQGPKEVPKEAFQATMAKVAAEGNLSADAITDTKKLMLAITASKTLSSEEKSSAKAYLAANTTPAAQGTNTTIRMEGYGATREMPVLDTKNGNSPQYLSANEINRANQQEPGRYIPASEGRQALNRTALLEDIRGSIGQTRNSLAQIPEFTPGDKAMIAMAMRDRDPKSAVSQLIGGAAGASMSPAQQDYLINLAQLHEQAMAMRSVLGAGQGSEDLRAAILRTIPGPGTPNKAYAARQLDQFEATLNRLSRGVPNVKLREAPAQPAPAGPQADPMIKVQIPNMPPGSIHASQKARFLQDHPDAKVF